MKCDDNTLEQEHDSTHAGRLSLVEDTYEWPVFPLFMLLSSGHRSVTENKMAADERSELGLRGNKGYCTILAELPQRIKVNIYNVANCLFILTLKGKKGLTGEDRNVENCNEEDVRISYIIAQCQTDGVRMR